MRRARGMRLEIGGLLYGGKMHSHFCYCEGEAMTKWCIIFTRRKKRERITIQVLSDF